MERLCARCLRPLEANRHAQRCASCEGEAWPECPNPNPAAAGTKRYADWLAATKGKTDGDEEEAAGVRSTKRRKK